MKCKPEDIHALIIAELNGNITDDEKQLLHHCITVDPDLMILYKDMSQVLLSPEAILARQLLDERGNLPSFISTVPSKKIRLLPMAIGIASMLLLALGIFKYYSYSDQRSLPITNDVLLTLGNGKIVNLNNQDTTMDINGITLNNKSHTLTWSQNTNTSPSIGKIFVPVGKTYNITLSDGSIINLNSVTQLRFPFSFDSTNREIWVDGEAYINVTPNPSRPFIVHLPTATIKVLGTAFNVNTFDKMVKVSLVTGKVKMLTSADSALLQPGFTATIQADNSIGVTDFDQTEVLGWMQGVYIFHNSTIYEIASIIQRWYGIEIITDERLRTIHFYGVLDRNKPIEAFLENLRLTNEITYTISAKKVYIR